MCANRYYLRTLPKVMAFGTRKARIPYFTPLPMSQQKSAVQKHNDRHKAGPVKLDYWQDVMSGRRKMIGNFCIIM